MGFEKTFGALKSKKDIRDYKIVCMQTLPKEFELTPPPVRNQGSVSSCVAHTLSEIAEWHNAINSSFSDNTHMSPVWIYGNRRHTAYKNKGMCVRDAIKAVCVDGSALYLNVPGNKEVPDAIDYFESKYTDNQEDAYRHRFTGYAKCNGADAIKEAILSYGPVAFAVEWYPDMKYANGILNSKERKNPSGGHCMLIYGWNETGWLIQNSWGPCWGKKGRAILPYDFPITEAWAIYDTLDEGTTNVVKPWHTKFLSKFAKIINAILNFFLDIIQK